jgi:hypothetical protein
MLSGRRWAFTKATATKKESPPNESGRQPLLLNNYREAYPKKVGEANLQKRSRNVVELSSMTSFYSKVSLLNNRQ